jgi:RNA methyltransferase, TrmH family
MNLRKITSPTNSLLKVFRRALADGVTRDSLLAVEGPHLVEEALNAASVVVHSVLVSASGAAKFRGLLARLPREAEAAQVGDPLFQKVAQTEVPQGIAMLVELHPPDLTSILAAKNALLLVACGIQDPGNLGTMMRSAQAFGATALFTLKETVSPFNPKVVRASAGAIFRLPIFPDLRPDQLLAALRTSGVRIVAADRHSPAPLADADLRSAVAFLIGREASGLPPEVAREANMLLSIPLRPETDSVNAATAASIFLYEAARQRGFEY